MPFLTVPCQNPFAWCGILKQGIHNYEGRETGMPQRIDVRGTLQPTHKNVRR
jgi:hypothetical protein